MSDKTTSGMSACIQNGDACVLNIILSTMTDIIEEDAANHECLDGDQQYCKQAPQAGEVCSTCKGK